MLCLVRSLRPSFTGRGLGPSLRWLSSVPDTVVESPARPKKFDKRGPSLRDFLASSSPNLTRARHPDLRRTPPESHPYLTEDMIRGDGLNVYLDIFGCQMNTSDSELILSILEQSGYTRTINPLEADVWLLVTCSIREGAENKVINQLKKISRQKSNGNYRKSLKVGVLGCMAERLKDRLLSPKEHLVDVVAGPDAYRDLPRLLAVTQFGNQTAINVILSLEETYADVRPTRLNEDSVTSFVSIQRGCDNMCSYCIVPFTRGRERSRPMKTILDEIRLLSDQGVKEVTLLGQNVNSYNDLSDESVDLFVTGISSNKNPELVSNAAGFKTIYKPKPKGVRFADLLQKVSEINPEIRIRFTSPHPKDFPDEVLHLIKEKSNICKQLHLPAQSGNSRILDLMRRGYTREAYLDLVAHVRQVIPKVQISGDLIAGFCDETDDEFLDTLSLIDIVQYNNLYIFPYSLREKTHAHRKLEDNITDEVKHDRMNRLISSYRSQVEKLNKSLIGTQQIVLIEGDSRRSPNDFQGRTDGNTKVIFSKRDDLQVGDYCLVDINDATSQSLRGTIVKKTTMTEHYSCI